MPSRVSWSPVLVLVVLLVSGLPDGGGAQTASRTVSTENLQAIYGSLFESLDFMDFSGNRDEDSRLRIKKKEFGTYMAGVRGILFYSNIVDKVAEIQKTARATHDFEDVMPWEKLAGMKVCLQKALSRFGFSKYNPDFLRWARENLIPDPQLEYGGVKFKKIYRTVFRRFFRLMMESAFLVNGLDIPKETEEYRNAARNAKFDALDYLPRRFPEALSTFRVDADGEKLTPPMAIGFWLRRHMDGTAGELLDGLKAFMKAYDQDWYDSLRKQSLSGK